jgi:hypothetical protein
MRAARTAANTPVQDPPITHRSHSKATGTERAGSCTGKYVEDITYCRQTNSGDNDPDMEEMYEYMDLLHVEMTVMAPHVQRQLILYRLTGAPAAFSAFADSVAMSP